TDAKHRDCAVVDRVDDFPLVVPGVPGSEPAAQLEQCTQQHHGGRRGRGEHDPDIVQLVDRPRALEEDALHRTVGTDHDVGQHPVITAVTCQLDAGAGRNIDLAAG